MREPLCGFEIYLFLFDWIICLTAFMYLSQNRFPPSNSITLPWETHDNINLVSFQAAAGLGFVLGYFLNYEADLKMPIDPPLVLGLGGLLFVALPRPVFLYISLLQLGTDDILGFNIGSNVGSCLYLILTFVCVQYLGFAWPVGAGLVSYWFFKPRINYLLVCYIHEHEHEHSK
jgi:preprotein translocase subunit Sec61beta